jgi:UDP-glucuronate 4-epimerase
MHILVTGGAGFIGSNLIRTLFETREGIRITCIDNFDPFYPADIKQLNIRSFKLNPNFSFVYLDLAHTNPGELKEMIGDTPDLIVHMAAKAGVRPSIDDPLSYQEANIIGLQHLLDYALENGISKFVFASSSSVYGINDHFPWKEDEQLMPISPYAMTKQAGEMLGHVYSRLHSIHFTCLRFFTVYGPGQRPDLAIHKFTKAILGGKPITMYGDGNTSRDYTYVDDIVSGVISAMDLDKPGFEIINLGNHYSVPLKDLVSELEKVIGAKAIIEYLPEQAGDVPKTFADITKAKKLLNYNPATTLETGLRKFVDWFRKNEELLTGSSY